MSDIKHKLSKHPVLLYHNEIKAICSPLNQLDISYFSHVFIDCENRLSSTNISPNFFEYYFLNNYFDADIHAAKPGVFDKYVLWDLVEQKGMSKTLYEDGSTLFNHKHVFTIIKRSEKGYDYFHFATHKKDDAFNQVYMSNINNLEIFTEYYLDRVKQIKEISLAYDIKFELDKNADYDLENEESLKVKNNFKNLFLNDLKKTRKPRFNNLTIKEWQVLLWLSYGKTINEISSILNLAEVTINKKISLIKEKTGCYSLFKLGEFFQKYASNNPDFLTFLDN